MRGKLVERQVCPMCTPQVSRNTLVQCVTPWAIAQGVK